MLTLSGAEVKDAPRRVPQAMVSSVVINGVMAWAFVVTVLYCIGDLTAAMSGIYVYPIIEILYSATGSKGGTTAMMSLLVFLGIIAMFSTLASVSRLTWAFARDKGLPFSTFFAKVGQNPSLLVHTDTPGQPSFANPAQLADACLLHRHASQPH
jgi:choline transport protein